MMLLQIYKQLLYYSVVHILESASEARKHLVILLFYEI